MQEGAGFRPQYSDAAGFGQGEVAGLDGEREAIGMSHAGMRGGRAYSFSIVHCRGCWFRRA